VNRILTAAVIGAVALVATGCGNPYGPADVVAVQSVKLTPQSLQLAIGETKALAAVITPANATDQQLLWESTDSTVAAVDADGHVVGRRAGAEVFVTVFTHDGHRQASVNITVNP
jgi:uncharacterized protein YjdB